MGVNNGLNLSNSLSRFSTANLKIAVKMIKLVGSTSINFNNQFSVSVLLQ